MRGIGVRGPERDGALDQGPAGAGVAGLECDQPR